MRIISDITGKEYKTVDECLADERAFAEKKAKEEADKKALAEKKDAAYKKAIAACDEYLKLCGIEVEFNDNVYKLHYQGKHTKADEIFEDILNMMVF